MPSIVELWIDTNPGLAGTIPESLGVSSTPLASLSATECSLTGTIPKTLGNITLLQQLWLYDNQLTGGIPSELGLVSNLGILDVAGNDLIGTMPEEVCDLTENFGKLLTIGADCSEITCECCTCCSLNECQPSQYGPSER